MDKNDFAHNSENFDEIKKYIGIKDILSENEAQTRFDTIDRIIKEFLNWRHGTIKVEEYTTGKKNGFIDYTLQSGDNLLIIEAKKIGASFPSPTHKEKLKLAGTLLSQGEIADALEQAHQYALNKSATLAIVTNGLCWCFYPLIGYNEDTQATLLFPFTIQGHAEKLFNTLSIYAVENGSLLNLNQSIENIDNRLISVVTNGDHRIERNNLADHIAPALDRALHSESVLNNPYSLEWIFVSTEARTKFDKTLGIHLSDIKSASISPAKRINREKNNDHLSNILKTSQTINTPPLTLIIGPVGAGKTTYLKHFEYVSGRSQIVENNIIWLYIDFEEMGPSKSPKDFIYAKLKDFLDIKFSTNEFTYKTLVEPAYKTKIDSLLKSVFAPIKENKALVDEKISNLIQEDYEKVEPYIEKLFTYLSSIKSVFIILDNTDLYENDELETNVFAEGLSLSKRIKSNIIVSIRDKTYIKHSSDSTFDAYELRKLWLDPPPLKSVLKKRLSYARYVLREKPVKITFANGMQLDVPDLGDFFEVVQSGILSGDAGDFIESLSDMNIRRGISLIMNFLTSGHINADKAIRVYLDGNKFIFPFQEIFKGTVLGQWKFYKEERAEAINLFNSVNQSKKLKLIRKFILNFMYLKSQSEKTMEFKVAEMHQFFQPAGLSEMACVKELNFLYKKSLIRNITPKEIEIDSIITLTKTGGYYINNLINRFQYTECCIYDTPIENKVVWENLISVTHLIHNETNIYDRMLKRRERIIIFLDYVIQLENEFLQDFSNNSNLLTLNKTKQLLIDEIDFALRKIKGHETRHQH
ncbi:hypothetical protein JWG41_11280 [Leptospira sp. 201903075]|uniref:hypothetical protein n=1 Tax=Leptospira chreensis TaxID=2810035 RepID=UPI001964F6C4|nr:hypothetical protein [Leptospira chreensis]MBM9591032.1 hypothetical protein [Leptospira chreensis]